MKKDNTFIIMGIYITIILVVIMFIMCRSIK